MSVLRLNYTSTYHSWWASERLDMIRTAFTFTRFHLVIHYLHTIVILPIITTQWITLFSPFSVKGQFHINLMLMRKWGHWLYKTDACFHFSFSDIKLNRPRSGHKNVQSDHQILVAPSTRSPWSHYQILMHFQVKFNPGIWWPEYRDLVTGARGSGNRSY